MKRFAVILIVREIMMLTRMRVMMVEVRRGGVVLDQSPINSNSPTHLFLQSSGMQKHMCYISLSMIASNKSIYKPEILCLLDFVLQAFGSQAV